MNLCVTVKRTSSQDCYQIVNHLLFLSSIHRPISSPRNSVIGVMANLPDEVFGFCGLPYIRNVPEYVNNTANYRDRLLHLQFIFVVSFDQKDLMVHLIQVLDIKGQRIEINDDMELRLSEFGILQGLDENVVFSLSVIGDGPTGPAQVCLNCGRVPIPLERFIKV
jgi:Fe2+ transport system protein FeoA